MFDFGEQNKGTFIQVQNNKVLIITPNHDVIELNAMECVSLAFELNILAEDLTEKG